MFTKLLKHEWKANAGLLGILSLCALGAGVLGIFVIRGMLYIIDLATELDNIGMALLGSTGMAGILFFIVIGLVAYALAVQFINLFRFYKSRFTDEGYLTFTLPVNSHQIFLSSFLNIVAWMVISFLVVLVSAALMFVAGFWEGIVEVIEAYKQYSDVVDMIVDEAFGMMHGYDFYTLSSIILSVVGSLYTIVMMMTSLTIGSVLVKKLKLLASVGIYYGINMAVGVLESVLMMIPTVIISASYTEDYYYYLGGVMLVSAVIYLGLAVGGYFLSTTLMKKKLNLP